MNPSLGAACQKIALQFSSPSGAEQPEAYRRVDKIAFAQEVLQELARKGVVPKRKSYQLA